MLKKYSVIVFLLVFIVGCPSLQETKSFNDMTPKEKSIFLMSLYNNQYDSYVALYKKVEKTDAEKEFLSKQYKWLKEVYPYIELYVSYAENGVLPPGNRRSGSKSYQ